MEPQNPAPQQQAPTQPQIPPQAPQKSNSLNIFLGVLIFLLFLTNVATVYYLYSKNKTSKQTTQEETTNIKVAEKETTSNPEIIEEEENIIEEEEENPEIKLAANEVLVDWKEWPVEADWFAIFKTNRENISNEQEVAAFISKTKFYEAGEIIKGVYEGNDLFLVNFISESPAAYGTLRVVVDDNNDFIIIHNDDDNMNEDVLSYLSYGSLFKIDNNTKIANLDNNPKKISIQGSNSVFVKTAKDTKKIMVNYDAEEVLTTNDAIIYKESSRHCFLGKQNDGMAISYILELDFIGEQSEEANQYLGQKPYLLEFNHLDGKSNENEYMFSHYIHGSFETACYTYADFINSADQLNIIGNTKNDDPIYSLKDTNIKERENDTKPILEIMYDRIYPEEGRISYEKFLADNPLLFWQDPFGDYVMFKNAEYMPAVEMGKPVIYLYPEHTMDVSVKVYPNNGLSITEPSYKNGWLVKADPNGDLYNYDDNKNYPYLFWEGHGLDYKIPQEGFVVAKNKVEKFLIEKLSVQGLVKHEYDEFIDFWLPRMQENDYYFITFMEQFEFDKLAPLDINPRPDTTIRVFMDYKGLDKYTNVSPQHFETPSRNGFTVVEWGGALHK